MIATQADFRNAILDSNLPTPENLQDGRGAPAGRRFAVYRNNVAVSLTDALETGFPTVAKLLGDENFRPLAGLFLRANPPQSPLMMDYGAGFPEFLAGIEALSDLGYLPDVARLDLAMRGSYHAADATPILSEVLINLPPHALDRARFSLAQAVQLIRSEWPIHGIYQFNHVDGAPQPTPRGEDVLITRPDFDPMPRLLPHGGGAFVAQLMAGAALGVALDAVPDDVPEFDLTAMLTLLMQDGCIAQVECPE